MNLGCLEDCMFVSYKQSSKTAVDSQNKEEDATSESSMSSSSRIGKNKSPKETSPSALNALNKFTSQIKKPPHRKNSPLNWFPRKKIDSYLKRKIKMLQEVDGMNLTLDETLEDSNPHYCRVLREQMAAREAAHKAMEARKAALVEASWCRILQAARIRSKEAEELLLKAEKTAAEAFESATALGVIMYDIPNCPQSTYQIETSSVNRAGSATHTVRASFETAFEVDKQVAAAVKTAFVRLACCSSFGKNEFKDLLRKINENPDTGDSNLDTIEFSSECESEPGSELDSSTPKDGCKSEDLHCKTSAVETRQGKFKRRHSLEKFNTEKLVEMMLERLKCLQEDELSSLATIVATCGLNAALAEVENTKVHNPCSIADPPSVSALNFARRTSSIGAGTVRKINQTGQVGSELPSLDKFLVKHMTKLEREVQEARSRRNESKEERAEEEIQEKEKIFEENSEVDNKSSDTSVSAIADLGSVLVKHSPKLEKEIQAAKRNCGNAYDPSGKKRGGMSSHNKADNLEVPSLDKFLVKHVSRLEREVEEAKNRRRNDLLERGNVANSEVVSEKNVLCTEGELVGKENINLNKEVNRTENEDSLDRILVKPVHRLEKEKLQALSSGSNYENPRKHKRQVGTTHVTDCESLDKVLVKHVSRLEKEKMRFNASEEIVKVKRDRGVNVPPMGEYGSLDQILVKHKSRLEKEKMTTAEEEQPRDQQIRFSVSRREARERELQEAWGGLSLGNSMRPHFSRLERDKAAWRKAEEEERMQAMKEV
ncbi:hypothetical protein PTKIN_Ptkin10aG0123600 [Pterospermum kingtungense]